MRAVVVVFGLALLAGQSGGAAEDPVTAAARRNFGEYLELLAIPNLPDKPDDMGRNAAFLEKAFQKRGFSTQLLDNPAGRPLVFARSDAGGPGDATIPFYIPFDGQPVPSQQVAQKNPVHP